MQSRERILLALNHKESDRVAIHDNPWTYTIQRWLKEGLPKNVDHVDYFGYEISQIGIDTSFQLDEEVIEETENHKIFKDNFGTTKKIFKDHESTPQLIDFTVKDRKTWEEYKPKMAWNDARVDRKQALADVKTAREKGKFVTYSGGFGYDLIQGIVGAEQLLMLMVEDPGLVKDMFETAVDLLITGAEEMMGRGFKFDGAFVYNDMGYRNATLFSPAVYRELEFPSQKRLYNFFAGKGMPVILHSCGCVKEFIPMLIEAGLTCLQPLEVKAGMDLVELKRNFGDRLAFMGGIDVRSMAHPDPAVIEKEIGTKIPFAKKRGGYIYHSDHSVPNNISFQQYCRVIELVKKYGSYNK